MGKNRKTRISRAARGVGPRGSCWEIEGPEVITFGLCGVPSPPTHFRQFRKTRFFNPKKGGLKNFPYSTTLEKVFVDRLYLGLRGELPGKPSTYEK